MDEYTVSQFFNDYCPGNTVYDGFVNYGGGAQPNLLINGTFTWDGIYEFRNCNFVFGDGARILNNSGASMTFENCRFSAGCGNLWQGIELEVASNISMFECYVEDAYYAIWQRKPSHMSLTKVTFDNNYIGVKYGHFGYGSPVMLPIVSTIPGSYDQVNFFGNGTLLPAYSGLIGNPTLPANKPYAGIHAMFVYNLDLSKDIVFGDPTASTNNRLNSGIICINGGLNVHTEWDGVSHHGVHFGNILANGQYGGSVVPNGCAIYASGDPRHIQGSLTVAGTFGGVNISSTNFNHCSIGIYSEQMYDNQITNNQMEDVNRGIYVGHAYGQMAIVENYLYVNRKGIELAYCSPNTVPHPIFGGPAITVDANMTTLGSISANASNFGEAFTMYEAPGNTDPADASMYLNQVEVKHGLYGWHLQNVRNSTHTYCNSFLSFSGRQFGIKVENCRNITWTCGGHQTDPALFASNPDHYGAFVRNSPECVWECIWFANHFRDMHFQGNCKYSNIRGNWLDPAWDAGIYIETNGVTGHQINQGNMWIDPALTSNFPLPRAAVNANSAFMSSRFEVDPAMPVGFGNYYLDPNYNLTDRTTPGHNVWFFDNYDPTYVCGGLCTVEGQHDPDRSIDTLIAVDSTLTSGFVEESKKMMQQDLFETLMKDPAMVEGSSIFMEFYESKLNTNTEYFALIKERINRDLTDRTLNDDLNTKLIEINLRKDDIALNDILLNSGTLTTLERLELEAVNAALRDEMIALLFDAQILKAEIYDKKINQADEILEQVSAIAENDMIEYNQRIVYQIYLKTVARGSYEFDEQQKEDLLKVAIQCPDAGGDAVVSARIMYDRVDSEIDYDDEKACEEANANRVAPNYAEKHDIDHMFVFEMFPNPAKEKVQISYTIDESAMLMFYTATGQQVYSISLEPGSHTLELKTSALKEGAYSWKLQTSLETKNGKLFVIK